MTVLLRQAKVADPNSPFHLQTVDILFDRGAIRQMARELPLAADEEINIGGLYIAPGFVDVFADYREPGYEHKETIESGLRAAAGGGFTDVLLAPNTKPSVSSKSIVQFVLQKAKDNLVNLHPIGSITQDLEGKSLAEMLDMRVHGALAFSDGWKPVQEANLMLKALEYAKAFDGILVEIPLEQSLSRGGLMHEGILSTELGMSGIPELAETLLLHRDLELLRYTQSRIHFTGVSTKEGVAMICAAKKEGLQVTCSVTPYHLALTDAALRSYSSLYKVSPVLRSEEDRQALIEGLIDGTIDCIASHHRPHEWDAKAKEFEYAGDGMNLQQICFNIVWDAVKNQMAPEELAFAFSVRPRKIFGLESATIREGATCCTLFTTEQQTLCTSESLHSTGINNPFIGKSLSGRIIGVLNNHQIQLKKQ